MPRNVRNFWLTLNVDGRSSQIATGPRSKDGGFDLRIYQRGAAGACAIPVLTIHGIACEETGNLSLQVWGREANEPAFQFFTKR